MFCDQPNGVKTYSPLNSAFKDAKNSMINPFLWILEDFFKKWAWHMLPTSFIARSLTKTGSILDGSKRALVIRRVILTDVENARRQKLQGEKFSFCVKFSINKTNFLGFQE